MTYNEQRVQDICWEIQRIVDEKIQEEIEIFRSKVKRQVEDLSVAAPISDEDFSDECLSAA